MSFLYKYRDISENTLDIFLNKRIFLPDSSQFNDPFDAKLFPNEFINDLRDLGYQDSCADFEQSDTYVNERLHNYGIYSLSHSNHNTLMWSHYAASHTGICIGFHENITHHFTNYEWSIKLNRIIYGSEHPFKKILSDLNSRVRFNNEDQFTKSMMLSNSLVTAALTVKHSNWSYEEESRVISEVSGFQAISCSAIDRVILGMNISKENEKTIRDILSRKEWKHVKLYRAVRIKATLNLEIIEASSH